MNGFERLMDYYHRDWEKRRENVWRSFTWGACVSDWVEEWHLSLSELWIEWEVNNYIESKSGANREWVEELDDWIKVLLCDNAFLDELMEEQSNDYHEEQKDELLDELEWEEFKTRDEVIAKVEELMDEYDIENYSSEEIADEFIDNEWLDFDEMLYDYLDWYSFVNKTEIVGAIEQYFYPDEEWQKESASYWELSKYEEMADEYMNDRNIEFEEEEDNN